MHDLRRDSPLPPYMVYPRCLLGMDINETARIIYVLLLDRARLSRKNGWEDEMGHVYIYYTIGELARDAGVSEMTVKRALASLTKADLIRRVRQGANRANRLYVRIPEQTTDVPSGQTIPEPTDRPNPAPRREQQWSPNKNKSNIYPAKRGWDNAIYNYNEEDSL